MKEEKNYKLGLTWLCHELEGRGNGNL